MKRRDFLKTTGAVGGGLFAGLGSNLARGDSAGNTIDGPQPNILFILVDELRYPTVFPEGINNAGEFIHKFMPNLHRLWKAGVKFENYHTAANACTPARGTIISGLYSQQNWLMTTLLSQPSPAYPNLLKIEPVLNKHFPTYGKLLRDAGYSTPYCGKWHVSIPQIWKNGLEPYGFDFISDPDPTGSNLQGTYGGTRADPDTGVTQTYHSDAYTAQQAVDWLSKNAVQTGPWCLTVGFVNPHDREFFPAGTEFQTVTDMFNGTGLAQISNYSTSGPEVSWRSNALKNPPSYGYPAVPDNWESTADLIARNKPNTQLFIKEFQQAVWGGVTDEPSKNTPASRIVADYPNDQLHYGIAKMEFTYWRRGLDSYTQVMQAVDCEIGKVIDAVEGLPKHVRENTVIVFASDHGEYAGAHGLLQGKLGSVYEEAWRIPLIVVDPSSRFTGEIDTLRTGLASSVDLCTMLISLGHNGSRRWMRGPLADIYGDRLDLIAMLRSSGAPGRPWLLYATDEIAPGFFNFNNCPTHVLGFRTPDTKLGVYANWRKATSAIDPASIQLEFYDYSTTKGQLELENIPDDPRAKAMLAQLLRKVIPNELQKPLPAPYAGWQELAKIAHLTFRGLIENLPLAFFQSENQEKTGGLKGILGYGADF